MSLHITPARRDLLEAVGRGEVYRDHRWGLDRRHYPSAGDSLTVTGAIRPLHEAALVAVLRADDISAIAYYELTDAGRAVLDGA